MGRRGAPEPLIPVDADVRARFVAELPAIIAWREQRLLPGKRRWGIEALAYGLLTLAGLAFFEWSAMLVFAHLALTQWIALVAELLALRRLARQGVTRLLGADQVDDFVALVDVALEQAERKGASAVVPRIPGGLLPDAMARNDTAKNAPPLAIAAWLVIVGAIATALLVAALVVAEGSLRAELLAQPMALACLAGCSLVQLATQFRQRLEAPMVGARWNVEFRPGSRMVGLILLAMIAPAVVESAGEVREFAMACQGAIAFWGVVTLLSLGRLRRRTARLRRHLDA
jgi:hypothetical protein